MIPIHSGFGHLQFGLDRALRLSVALGLILVFSTAISAQSDERPGTHLGLRAGPTISYLSGSFVEDGGLGEWGVELKLSAARRVFANVDFVTGFGTSQKGGRSVDVVGNDTTFGYRFSYLQLPLMLRPMFRIADSNWFVGPISGVYVGLNPSCAVKDARFFEFEDDCSEETAGGLMETTEIGIPIGVDAILEFPEGMRVEFEARIDFGLTNIFDEAAAMGLSATNRVIVIEFGFAYPL